jgi:hypothetical protein
MNPAPTLLSEWITPTGFAVIVLLLLLLAIGVVIAENLHDRREDTQDDLYAQDVLDYYCAGNGHKYVGGGSGDWLCAHCGDVVRRPLNCGGRHRYETSGQSLLCTVCGHRTALPYDRENGVA